MVFIYIRQFSFNFDWITWIQVKRQVKNNIQKDQKAEICDQFGFWDPERSIPGNLGWKNHRDPGISGSRDFPMKALIMLYVSGFSMEWWMSQAN